MSPFAGVLAGAVALGVASAGHCVAMCGGVVGLLEAGLDPAMRGGARRASALLAYNAGRVGSYGVAGAVAGAFGVAAERAFPLDGLRLGLRLFAGLVLFALGLRLVGLMPRSRLVEALGARFFARLSPLARRVLPVRSPAAALGLGALWGWLPCGMVYGALALALAAGSAMRGALVLGAFGLGTVPALLVLGTALGKVRSWLANAWARRVTGVVVAAAGVLSLTFALVQLGAEPRGHAADVVCAATRAR
jgi:sulfite exporter TauE/SafE